MLLRNICRVQKVVVSVGRFAGPVSLQIAQPGLDRIDERVIAAAHVRLVRVV
jgi:hypothetical protein